MEFSFDRNNDNRSRTTSSTTGQTSTGQQQTFKPDDGVDTSNIANERLRKAIERNRARQAERTKQRPEMQATVNVQPTASQPEVNTQSAQPAHETIASGSTSSQQSIFDRQTTSRPRAQERIHTSASSAPSSSAIITRKSVARPDEADFTPIKRAPRKVANHISYTTSSSRKKVKSLDPKWQQYLIKGSWIFCGVLVLRLIFASGGVSDFYNQKVLYLDRLKEIERIKKENMQLVRDIERMQSDYAYQKKLVRDNLGFIAADEFLVLFPKEKSIQ